MKTLIAAALILAANNAAANGFSPWSDTKAQAAPLKNEISITEDAGFGPWRTRKVTDEIRIRTSSDPIFTDHAAHVFSPWS